MCIKHVVPETPGIHLCYACGKFTIKLITQGVENGKAGD